MTEKKILLVDLPGVAGLGRMRAAHAMAQLAYETARSDVVVVSGLEMKPSEFERRLGPPRGHFALRESPTKDKSESLKRLLRK